MSLSCTTYTGCILGNNIFDFNCFDQEIPRLEGLIDDPSEKNYVEELKRYYTPISIAIFGPACYSFLWFVLAFISLHISIARRLETKPMDNPPIAMSDMDHPSTQKIGIFSPSLMIEHDNVE